MGTRRLPLLSRELLKRNPLCLSWISKFQSFDPGPPARADSQKDCVCKTCEEKSSGPPQAGSHESLCHTG